MTDITRTQRLIEQLRSRIGTDRPGQAPVRAAASPPAPAGGAGTGTRAPSTSPAAMVKRLHEAGITDERVLVGRLVEGLLLGELGDGAQGANFQYVLGQVVQTLEQDPESWALCQACVAEAIG
ncbi:MAG: hypothetical protein GAK28_04565 [Luteibacter sp.]|uniref:hypothetical protein n=1 Tax=Luteibacter sp. TaxID=1886636 RepID=UPI001380A5D5|nr:hypothetical protein [Luteibacter sp.]KAF1003684.1 MAG: hypothetical protein GAK28_04565 [Luteibacter sp.]